MDYRASLEGFVGARTRGGKEIREYSRLSSYESAIDSEGSFVGDEDEVTIIIPDFGVARKIRGRGGHGRGWIIALRVKWDVCREPSALQRTDVGVGHRRRGESGREPREHSLAAVTVRVVSQHMTVMSH